MNLSKPDAGIGAALRAERQRRGMSRADLASRSGLSERRIAALERNVGRVDSLVALEPVIAIAITGLRKSDTLIGSISRTRADFGWSLRHTATRTGLAVNTLRSLERGTGSIAALIQLIRTLSPSGYARAFDARRKPRGLITVAKTRNLDRDPLDHYPTPPAIVRLLLDHETFPKEEIILEPAVGRLRPIDKVLRERGYKTVCSDINGAGTERRSFFDVTERYHTICTNPPWKFHNEFVQHARRVATHKFVFLMPLNYLTGAARLETLWKDHEFPVARVFVMNRGIDFVRSDPESDVFKAAQVYMAWYVFERGFRGPPSLHWINSNALVERKTK